jgi:hypothetical protein
MHIILRYPTRRRVEAILLSATTDRMRIVIKNQDDAIELRLVGSQWVSDRGSAVEIDSIMTDDPNAVAQIWSDARPRVSGAAY